MNMRLTAYPSTYKNKIVDVNDDFNLTQKVYYLCQNDTGNTLRIHSALTLSIKVAVLNMRFRCRVCL